MVDGVDDVVLRGEQTICLDFFQGLRHRLLAKGASDLLESEQFGGRFVLNEVDVGETALLDRELGHNYWILDSRRALQGLASYLAEQPE